MGGVPSPSTPSVTTLQRERDRKKQLVYNQLEGLSLWQYNKIMVPRLGGGGRVWNGKSTAQLNKVIEDLLHTHIPHFKTAIAQSIPSLPDRLWAVGEPVDLF